MIEHAVDSVAGLKRIVTNHAIVGQSNAIEVQPFCVRSAPRLDVLEGLRSIRLEVTVRNPSLCAQWQIPPTSREKNAHLDGVDACLLINAQGPGGVADANIKRQIGRDTRRGPALAGREVALLLDYPRLLIFLLTRALLRCSVAAGFNDG